MQKAEAVKLVENATVVARGDTWGDPLWQVSIPNGTVDVHAADEVEARKKAADFLVVTSDD
jgi:hypothetical protein